MKPGAPHIFISHGSDDRAEADQIADYLEQRGLRVWIAPRDVRPGRDYSEQLQEAIEKCSAFVVLVSERSNKSPYVRVETELAFSGNIPIFPVRTSKVEPGAGLALFLKIKHWTDAFGPQRDHNLERLAEELELLAGAPAGENDAAPAVPPASHAPASPPPIQPPPFPPPGPAGQEERLRAFIGPNSDYYLAKWRQMEAPGAGPSWNWAAFLLNGLWLAYRKMWLAAAVFIGGFSILFLAAVALIAFGAVDGLLPLILVEVLGVGAAAWLGLNGNRLYRREAEAALPGAGGAGPGAAAVKQGGGTSIPAAIAIGIAWAAVLSVPYWIEFDERRGLESAPDRRGGEPDSEQEADSGSGPEAAAARGDAAREIALTQDYLVGRWGDNGDCSSVLTFEPDGTVYAPDGTSAQWSLDGDTLSVQGPGGTNQVRIEVIDRNRFRGEGDQTDTVRCD